MQIHFPLWTSVPVEHMSVPDVPAVSLRSTSCELHLDGTTLHGLVGPCWGPAQISLDSVLGNCEGLFQWGGGAFSKTAKNISLDGTILHAVLSKSKGGSLHAAVDLASHIYVQDGKFKVSLPLKDASRELHLEKNTTLCGVVKVFHGSEVKWEVRHISLGPVLKAFGASAKCVRLEGMKLYAEFQDTKGKWHETPINLDDVLEIADGCFQTVLPFRSATRALHFGGNHLHALAEVLPHDPCAEPKWQPTTFDLDRVLGNHDGTFSHGGMAFSKSARDVRLYGTSLRAELRTQKGDWKHAEFELEGRFFVKQGQLWAMNVPADSKAAC